MASRYVVKVQYEDTMRRFTLGEGELDYSQLEIKTRDFFQLAPSVPLLLTYTDKDGDEVTLANDEDLTDALVLQSINPLRLSLKVAGTSKNNTGSASQPELPMAKNSSVVDEILKSEKGETRSEAVLTAEKNTSSVNAEVTSDTLVDSPSDPQNNMLEESAPAAENDLPVHYGIQCDVCDTTPIKGSRYKSTTKVDYDLCSNCFEGTSPPPNEYVKIDRSFDIMLLPFCSRNRPELQKNSSLKGVSTSEEPTPNATVGSATVDAKVETKDQVQHHGVRCDDCGKSPIEGPRLISRTKWNYDLCLSCFEKTGDDKSKFLRVDEPNYRPPFARGRRMHLRAPFGRFGPFIWTPNGTQGTDVKRTEIPVTGGETHDQDTSVGRPGEISNSEPDDAGKKEGESLNANEEKKSLDQTKLETAPEATTITPNLSAAEETSLPPTAEEDDLSSVGGLLGKLAAMGFTDPQINTDMLERNQFDLRKTVDDLCATEEWAPIFGELQEMGFYDASLNRRLMFKYNGNVKLVVKELVKLSKSQNNEKGSKQS